MSVEILDSIKKQSSDLSPQEKSALVEFLLSVEKEENLSEKTTEEIKRRQLEWLKNNREKYAGQYVALDSENLVGYGATLREATEQATRKNVKNPFVFRVFSEETIVSAGL